MSCHIVPLLLGHHHASGNVITWQQLCTHAGWTALHYAARFNHGAAARKLIETGADVNAETVQVCEYSSTWPPYKLNVE
jgi:hypothetical protein